MELADLIFPRICLGCKKEGKYICSDCLAKTSPPKPICPICTRASIDGMTHIKCQKPQGLDGLVSIWTYDKVVRKAILSMKYKFALEIAKELADLSLEKLKKAEILTSKKLALVPIPLHWYRENWRGFNQEEEIGKLVAGKMGWDFIPNLLVKKAATTPQAELKRERRLVNVRNAFVLNPHCSLLPSAYSLVLFDDVWTTGSTIKEAAKVLKRNGAKSVWGLTLCR